MALWVSTPNTSWRNSEHTFWRRVTITPATVPPGIPPRIEKPDTGLDVLICAFRDAGVHIDLETIGGSDKQMGIRVINRIMNTLYSNNVVLGFTKLTTINDIITIPEGLIDSLISIVAMRIWPKYRNIDAPVSLTARARNGVKKMYKRGVSIGVTEFPSLLPRGSVDERYKNFRDDVFFDNLASQILPDNNGSIGLEN